MSVLSKQIHQDLLERYGNLDDLDTDCYDASKWVINPNEHFSLIIGYVPDDHFLTMLFFLVIIIYCGNKIYTSDKSIYPEKIFCSALVSSIIGNYTFRAGWIAAEIRKLYLGTNYPNYVIEKYQHDFIVQSELYIAFVLASLASMMFVFSILEDFKSSKLSIKKKIIAIMILPITLFVVAFALQTGGWNPPYGNDVFIFPTIITLMHFAIVFSNMKI